MAPILHRWPTYWRWGGELSQEQVVSCAPVQFDFARSWRCCTCRRRNRSQICAHFGQRLSSWTSLFVQSSGVDSFMDQRRCGTFPGPCVLIPDRVSTGLVAPRTRVPLLPDMFANVVSQHHFGVQRGSRQNMVHVVTASGIPDCGCRDRKQSPQTLSCIARRTVFTCPCPAAVVGTSVSAFSWPQTQ